jgi:hypothetical protein
LCGRPLGAFIAGVMLGRGRFFATAALAAGLAACPSCTPPPRMCALESDCGAQASCVAGRCVPHGATPAIATARRMLVTPLDVGWACRGDGTGSDVATLGRGDGAVLFLRFSVPLRAETSVVEGYLLLDRAPGIDSDPGTLTLHAVRVEGAWDARTLSWARQPSVVEQGAPITTVQAAGGGFIRLDVRSIVERWRRRDRMDGGIAVVSEGQSPTGLSLALAPADVPPDRDDPVLAPPPAPATQPPSPFEPRVVGPAVAGDPRRQAAGPRLELYVR